MEGQGNTALYPLLLSFLCSHSVKYKPVCHFQAMLTDWNEASVYQNLNYLYVCVYFSLNACQGQSDSLVGRKVSLELRFLFNAPSELVTFHMQGLNS